MAMGAAAAEMRLNARGLALFMSILHGPASMDAPRNRGLTWIKAPIQAIRVVCGSVDPGLI
jgi:hypothetical protein